MLRVDRFPRQLRPAEHRPRPGRRHGRALQEERRARRRTVSPVPSTSTSACRSGLTGRDARVLAGMGPDARPSHVDVIAYENVFFPHACTEESLQSGRYRVSHQGVGVVQQRTAVAKTGRSTTTSAPSWRSSDSTSWRSGRSRAQASDGNLCARGRTEVNGRLVRSGDHAIVQESRHPRRCRLTCRGRVESEPTMRKHPVILDCIRSP